MQVGELVNELEGSRKVGVIIEVYNSDQEGTSDVSVLWRDGTIRYYRKEWLEHCIQNKKTS